MTVKEYLEESIPYGGVMTPRGQVIEELSEAGWTERMIDRYLQGLDLTGTAIPVASSDHSGPTCTMVAP